MIKVYTKEEDDSANEIDRIWKESGCLDNSHAFCRIERTQNHMHLQAVCFSFPLFFSSVAKSRPFSLFPKLCLCFRGRWTNTREVRGWLRPWLRRRLLMFTANAIRLFRSSMSATCSAQRKRPSSPRLTQTLSDNIAPCFLSSTLSKKSVSMTSSNANCAPLRPSSFLAGAARKPSCSSSTRLFLFCVPICPSS